jgi:phage/plasmid primase-like uncharacterized protein
MIVAAAKAVAVEAELARRGITLKRAGRELVGPCPVCGGTDRFAVNAGKNIWNCRGCAKGGDVIDLVQHIDGVAFGKAIKILTGDQARSTPAPTPRPKIDGDEHEQRQRAKAHWLWKHRQPIAGSFAERYLREARGYTGALPPTIAFLPARDEYPPAMIAAFALADESEPGVLREPDSIAAVHLTLLKPDGTGKADVDPNKIVVASPAGMPIMVAAMNDLGGLAICEGIEDALSVHQATGLGAWAAGAACFMPKLTAAIKRASPSCVTIFADDDVVGQCNARELATELHEFTEVFLREARS